VKLYTFREGVKTVIKGSKDDFIVIIEELEKSITESLKSEHSTEERISGYRERMARLCAKDYYEKQISEEEKLLSQLRRIRENGEKFLGEVKKSYSEQYGI